VYTQMVKGDTLNNTCSQCWSKAA